MKKYILLIFLVLVLSGCSYTPEKQSSSSISETDMISFEEGRKAGYEEGYNARILEEEAQFDPDDPTTYTSEKQREYWDIYNEGYNQAREDYQDTIESLGNELSELQSQYEEMKQYYMGLCDDLGLKEYDPETNPVYSY